MGSRLGLSIITNSVSVECLIDTGACVSLLHKVVFDKICKVSGRSKLLKSAPPIYNVSGKPITVFGKTEVDLGKLGSLPVIVVGGITHECILGDDALSMGKAVLNYVDSTLRWKDKVFRVHPYKSISLVDMAGNDLTVAMDYVSNGFSSTKVPAEYVGVLRAYDDVFYEDGNAFGQCPLTEVRINTSDHPPICQRPYRTPLAKRKVIDECVDQMLQDGVIYPSNSPWASPVCLVPKKDGTTRFCVDYRALNEVTVKDRYPLPLIQDIFDQLGGKVVYSVCDLKAAYNQLKVAECDQDKTAFVCHRGLFNYRVGSFGLANMPAIFQRTMEMALSDLLGKCVWVFIDDLVIASSSAEEHQRDLAAVFT